MRERFAAAIAVVLLFVCPQIASAEALKFAGDPPPIVTFATLPTCNATTMKGAQRRVSDSNTTTHGATVAGGGASLVVVECDGTNWKINVPGATVGGGSSAFNDVTSGTNTTAAMVVGTGASLAVSGSGTIAATTAAALAANGANCSAGSYPLGVNAAGAVESCTVATTGTVTSALSSDGFLAIADETTDPDITLSPVLGAITGGTDNTFIAASGSVWNFALSTFGMPVSSTCAPTSGNTCFDNTGITGATSPLLVLDVSGTDYYFPSFSNVGTDSTKRVFGLGAGNATETTLVTATPTASAIPLADGSNKLADGWLNSTVMFDADYNTSVEVRDSGLAIIPEPNDGAGCTDGQIISYGTGGSVECDTHVTDASSLTGLNNPDNLGDDAVGITFVIPWAGNPNGSVACDSATPTEVQRKFVRDTTGNRLWVCTVAGAEAAAVWQLATSTMSRYSACSTGLLATCRKLADDDGDGFISDDLQRIINELLWPSGTATTAKDVYIEAPNPGRHYIGHRIVACADTSPPSGATAPDCTGTTGTTPTIHFVGAWDASVFYSSVVLNTTGNDGHIFEFGNSWNEGSVTAADGVAAVGSAVSSGEVRIQMESRINVVIVGDDDYGDYSGNPGGSAPPILSCNGCRGKVMFGGRDDGSGGFDLTSGNTFFVNAGQDLEADLVAHTSDVVANASTNIMALGLGPGSFASSRIKWDGYRSKIYVGGSSDTGGGGTVILEPRITLHRSDAAAAIQFQRWDRPTIENAHITLLPKTNGGASTSSLALDFSVSASAAAPQKFGLIRNSTFECLPDSSSGEGCIQFTGCGTSVQSRFRIENSRIVMNGDSFTGTGAGGISVEDSVGGACTGTDLAPVVEMAGVSYQNTGSSATTYVYANDTDAAANRKGFFLASSSDGGEWFETTILDTTDLASESCFNLTQQDPSAGDEILACTDERTKLYAVEDSMMLMLGVRTSNSGATLTSGDGCAIYPRINGTSESGANGIAHTLVTGQTGLEANGDTDWVFVNRPVTVGQALQVAIADSLGADNVAGGTSANADEACQAHVGTRVWLHYARMGPPKYGTTTFGAGN